MNQGSARRGDELRRMYRVADTMTTAHAWLRDRLASRALALDVVMMGASLTACVLALAGHPALGALRLDAAQAAAVLSIASAVVFLASVVSYKVDWKGQAAEHARAGQAYGAFKLRWRLARDDGQELDARMLARAQDDWRTLAQTCIPVPEASFVHLKRVHLRKVALSRMLDERPHASLRLAAMRLWLRDTWAVLRGTPRDREDGEAGLGEELPEE